MNILIVDNYDSFTYNLLQCFKKAATNAKIDVLRNDAFDLEAIANYDLLVLSPGPGLPQEAGLLLDVIKKYASTKPILGVCLGHQAIAEAFGGKLEQLKNVYHGKMTKISMAQKEEPLFEGLANTFEVGRYHSWVINKQEIPCSLLPIAFDEKGEIMALKHQEYPVFGLQFHPESVLTSEGQKIINNFLKIATSKLKERISA